MKQWLMAQRLVALSTVYRKTPEKQTTYITPKGAEKQLDYILVNRNYPKTRKESMQTETYLTRSGNTTNITTQVDDGTKYGQNSRFEERYQELEKRILEREGSSRS